LIIAGATLVYKRIQIINDMVLMLVMIFSASALPLIHVPDWWAGVSHLFPVTDGVGSLYNIMIAQRSASSAWSIGGVAPLLIVPTAYLFAGIGTFVLGERVAKNRGTLGRY
ncbi:MAG TPA: ABC transporter permease, partial [Candidatus Dormibacteraeota bacterium]|nr:ABC transporter permease [Candidatus Dormibacteraeota bacterium]